MVDIHPIVAKEVSTALKSSNYQSCLLGSRVKSLDKHCLIEEIFVLERGAADVESARCSGSVVNSWVFKNGKFDEVSVSLSDLQVNGIAVVEYFCTNSSELVFNFKINSRAGFGLRLKLNESQTECTPVGIGWNA